MQWVALGGEEAGFLMLCIEFCLVFDKVDIVEFGLVLGMINGLFEVWVLPGPCANAIKGYLWQWLMAW